MVLGLQVAAPLIAMLSITVAAGILVDDWRRVLWAGTWRLVLSTAVVLLDVAQRLFLHGVQCHGRIWLSRIEVCLSWCLWVPPTWLRAEANIGCSLTTGTRATWSGNPFHVAASPPEFKTDPQGCRGHGGSFTTFSTATTTAGAFRSLPTI
jgi:hypothetical protein